MENTVVVKIVDAMQKILPKTAIEREETFSKSLCGETVNFQIVFNNQMDGTIKFAKLDIKSEIKDKVRIWVEDLVPLTTFPDTPMDDYYSTTEAGLVPDLLRELTPTDFCLYKNTNKVCFISIDTNGLSAGEYDVDFVLYDDTRVYCEKKYQLKVMDGVLEKSELTLTNWMHYDCISDYFGVEVFSDEFYSIFDRYLKEYVDIGYTMIYTPLFTPPLDTYVGGERKTVQLIDIKEVDGNYVFNFVKLEKFITFCLQHGIKYFEFSHLFTQWGGKACPKILCEVNGENKKIFGWETPADSEEYKRFLDAFLPELVNFVKSKGLVDKCYFHLTDEPRAESTAAYAKCREIVKKHIGKIKILDAISEYEFLGKGLVDIAVPIISAYGEFREKYKGDLMVYYCCGPTDNYYTNRLLYMPLQRIRVLGLQLYLNEAKGFLHWGFNFYNTALSYSAIDPYKETDAGGMFPSGDAFIVYPNRQNNGVRSTLRAKAIKRSFEDYRLLKTLDNIKGKAFVMNLLEQEGVKGFSVYPKSSFWQTDFFEKVRDIIEDSRRRVGNN